MVGPPRAAAPKETEVSCLGDLDRQREVVAELAEVSEEWPGAARVLWEAWARWGLVAAHVGVTDLP